MPSPRTLLKRFAIACAAFVVLCGLLLGAFQVAVSRVPEYRVQVQNWVGERTGLVIEFSRLSARLRLFGPELVFHDAEVRTPDRTSVLATAQRGSVGFDLWTSIAAGRLTAGRFSLDSPQIGLIRARSGGIQLVGQSALPDRAYEPVAIEKLPIGRFEVRSAVVSFRDEATGRGPWALSGVSFILNRQPQSMELSGNAELPSALGQVLEFSGRADGALENASTVLATFRVEGRQLDLAGWADVFPDEWPAPETGHGSLLISGALQGAQLTSLAAQVNFSDIAAVSPSWTLPLPVAEPLRIKGEEENAKVADVAAIAIAPDAAAQPPQQVQSAAEMLSYRRIAFNIAANRMPGGWKMSATDIDVMRGARPWQAAALDVEWSKDDAQSLALAASADHLVLQNLWPLLAYLPQTEQLAHIRALSVNGEIDRLRLDFRRAGGAEPQYSLQAHLQSVGFHPVLRSPGISGLTGELRATQAAGQLQLQAQDVGFELPRMFRAPLRIEAVHGTIDWRREEQAWRLSSTRFGVESVDGNVLADFALTLRDDDSSPHLELTAQARDLDAAATPKYLPADKLTAKTLAWLDNAFPAGRVTRSEVRYDGPMRAFPFRADEGEFKALAHVDGLTFDYQRGWAPATQMTAEVEFHNEGMKVLSGTATLGALHIDSVSGAFPDFRAGNVSVDAVAAGDLNDALKFLQTSPVSGALGEQFQKLRGQGATQSRINMRLPLKRIADRTIVVATQLNDVSVAMDGVNAPITHLSGSLRVRQALPDSAQLQGQWLGGPLDLSITPAGSGTDDGQGASAVLTAKVQARAEQLTTLLHLPAAVKIDGGTQWQLSTQLTAGDGARLARKFTIDSQLAGLGIDLPYPLGKQSQETRPLRVELEYGDDDSLLTRTHLGDIRSLLRVQKSANGWSLDRGSVRADAVAAALPDHRGLRIEGSIDRLVLDEWFALRGRGSGDSKVADFLRSASLHIGTLQLFGYEWPTVRGILQATSSGWQVDVAGPNAVGSVSIPQNFTGSQPLTASLERLIVTKGQRHSGASSPSDPRSWPALRVFVANLGIGAHALGSIDLRTSRVAEGIRIDSLTLVQDALRGQFGGQWFKTDAGERSALNAKITSTNVGATLKALNYTQFLDASHGEISADLAWPGGFDGHFLSQASGTLSVNAQNGQLLNVQPGAGRVLGLLSVAALPRRLALDFSDLTDKGLSFDTVHGDFELRNGDAYTSNLLLRGPAAEIGMAGRTGLGARDYDQTAVVTGNLGATLPVAGALAGGPAVGAALLLFSRVFKEPLKGIARGYYRITGTWEEPVVERVDAAEGKEASAGGS